MAHAAAVHTIPTLALHLRSSTPSSPHTLVTLFYSTSQFIAVNIDKYTVNIYKYTVNIHKYKKVDYFAIQCYLISKTNTTFWWVTRLGSFVLLERALRRRNWIKSNDEMILTGENWSAGRKKLYSVCGRWMNEYGAMVEWYWQGKTEVLRGGKPGG
jgi:hypothetical protein